MQGNFRSSKQNPGKNCQLPQQLSRESIFQLMNSRTTGKKTFSSQKKFHFIMLVDQSVSDGFSPHDQRILKSGTVP
jgi:hypothetical protein